MPQAVREMAMESTSVLKIKWVLRGKPKFAGSGDLVLSINGKFTLNQISGQVVEHIEDWDLSGSSPVAQAYFWLSRLSYSTLESGKDALDALKEFNEKVLEDSRGNRNENVYRDPTDPTKVSQQYINKANHQNTPNSFCIFTSMTLSLKQLQEMPLCSCDFCIAVLNACKFLKILGYLFIHYHVNLCMHLKVSGTIKDLNQGRWLHQWFVVGDIYHGIWLNLPFLNCVGALVGMFSIPSMINVI